MFKVSNLGVQAHLQGQTFWAYQTEDNLTSVLTEGYFSSVSDMVKTRDWLFLTTSNASAILVFEGIQPRMLSWRSFV